jgi:hypothetical protein
MNKQANGQRAQAIKAGNIRPSGVGHVVKMLTAEDLAKSRAKAIAARRKELSGAMAIV